MASILDIIGKRVLLKTTSPGYGARQEVTEFRVLEVSPSGNWVKLQNLHGNKFWRTVTDVALVEVLRDLRPEPPPQ